MNLNAKQIISIVGVVLSVLMISTTQLTDLFGAGMAKQIVSVAALGNMILQGMMTVLTSQGSMVKDVLAMPGIESVKVNAQANTTLAQIAVDPTLIKIDTTPQATQQVQAIAKGT